MKNPDPNAVANAVVAVSNRLLDSNQFLLDCHGRMLDANQSLSDAMLEVHQSLCAVRDQMASEKDAAAFNDIILAMSGAMVLWCGKFEGVTNDIRNDYNKSKALLEKTLPTVEGLI